MRRWQLSLIPLGWITMHWPLLWDDDNCLSMFHTLGIYNHALTVFMRRWQLSEQGIYYRALSVVMQRWQLSDHVSYLRDILQRYVHDNCRSMYHYLNIYNHALTVVMRGWQLWEHVSYLRDIYYHALTVVMKRWQLSEHSSYLRVSICSDCCHETMTVDGA